MSHVQIQIHEATWNLAADDSGRFVAGLVLATVSDDDRNFAIGSCMHIFGSQKQNTQELRQ